MKNSLIYLVLFLISISAYSNEGDWLSDLVVKLPWLGYLLMGLGTLVVLAQIVVTITPTKKDDEFMEKTIVKKIVEVLSAFAVIKKK